MRRRTVLIPVLTLATITTAFSWWLWRELPLQPVRRIVLPISRFSATITVTKDDEFCLLSDQSKHSNLRSEFWQCLINLKTEEVILGPGGLERTEVGLSRSRPWAYMKVGPGWDEDTPRGDLDCYALDLRTWDWKLVFSGKDASESSPFPTDVIYGDTGAGADPEAEGWTVTSNESNGRIASRLDWLIPDSFWPPGWVYEVRDQKTGSMCGHFWAQIFDHPFVSTTGLIWSIEASDSDDQIVIAAYDPRVRPVPYWLWAVTAGCVASVAVVATWGRGRRK